MKVLAMYLPQFHRVKENDEWWGDGFTEWTTVKAAKPLFDGHAQPVVPYEENYYDLTEKTTMQWQADLMKQYGIDGVCMYHYWFKDGRKILEKPAENLLQWKDIDMPFCFCWANETWARTWSGMSNVNVWASTFEKKTLDGKRILLEQKYGEEQAWTEHFNYLLEFFKDDRYIKIDNKPVFMIYRPELMPCVERMIYLWNQLAVKAGFDGLYLLGGDCGDRSGIHDAIFDKIVCWEPGSSIRKLELQEADKRKSNVRVLGYDIIWNSILNRNVKSGKYISGGFVKYDDTPRRGAQGRAIEGASPEKFARYFTELLGKNAAAGNEMVFLNAWNEWGEGMYLEPDEESSYAYLEAINYAKKNYEKHVEEYHKKYQQSENKVNSAEGRCRHYLSVYEQWVEAKYQGTKLEAYFAKRGYKSVAIYGYGPLAKLMISELRESSVEIAYILDKNKEKVESEYPVYCIEDNLPVADVIVIAATFSSGVIFKGLSDKGYSNVISIEEIIENL